MGPYIYGHRNKIHIINLEQTLKMFNDALNYLSAIASKRGSIMFVVTKSQAGAIIQEQAQRANSPYVYHRWLGVMLTNYSTVRQSINRLNALEESMQADSFSKLSKKEDMGIEREHFRLNRNLAGIRNMKGLPEALFVVDVKHENIAVKEARKLGIPVVAVVDTNCDPDGIDYVIPGNDDSISAIRLYCTYAADAILAGYATIQNNPFFHDDDTAEGTESTVDITVTPAKAAVAPDDEERTEASQVSSENAAADAQNTAVEDSVLADAEPESAVADEANLSSDTEEPVAESAEEPQTAEQPSGATEETEK